MADMDEDGSGGIDFAEFIVFMSKSIDKYQRAQEAENSQQGVTSHDFTRVQESSRLYRTLYCLFQVEQRQLNFQWDKFIATVRTQRLDYILLQLLTPPNPICLECTSLSAHIALFLSICASLIALALISVSCFRVYVTALSVCCCLRCLRGANASNL